MQNTDFCSELCYSLHIEQRSNPEQLNPLVLAYVGDSVFDLAVRTLLVETHDSKAHDLHVMSARRVKASAQARAAEEISAMLDDAELQIFKRARNAKPGSIPKHASREDYAAATGFEALIGYLFLAGKQERMLELIKAAIETHPREEITRTAPFQPGRP